MKHGGYFVGPDRFSPDELQSRKWENAMTLDKPSWGFRRDINLNEIYHIKELIQEIVKTVSYGGNILMNVGPTKEGTIAPIFQERLQQVGSWLKVNGDAIYKTSTWTTQRDPVARNVYYTRRGDIVYAIMIGWPSGEVVTLAAPKATDLKTKITMLGLPDQRLKFLQKSETLHIEMPSLGRLISTCRKGCEWGYVLKLVDLKDVDAVANK